MNYAVKYTQAWPRDIINSVVEAQEAQGVTVVQEVPKYTDISRRKN